MGECKNFNFCQINSNFQRNFFDRSVNIKLNDSISIENLTSIEIQQAFISDLSVTEADIGKLYTGFLSINDYVMPQVCGQQGQVITVGDNNQLIFTEETSVLPNLNYNEIWIGDENNRPVGHVNIGVTNLPILGAATFPYPAIIPLPAVPIPNPTFDPVSGFDWLMSGPWLPQIFAGSTDTLDTKSETVISSSLAMTQVNVAQTIKRIDNGGFIVKTRTINFSWENPAMNLVPPVIRQLYGLNPTYTFGDTTQALDELGAGLISNDSEGTLTLATLTKGKVWIGDDNNYPTETTITIAGADAKYILQQPFPGLSNAQSLNDLGTGILKAVKDGVVAIASGGSTPLVDDYVTPLNLQTAILEANAFATEAAADAYASAVVTSNLKLDFEMLPYAPIPLYTYGLQISNDIGNRTDAVRNFFIDQMLPYPFNDQVTYGQQIKNDIQSIGDLTINLTGDVSGSNNIKNPIATTFTPNPTFTGNQYMRIPTGTTSQRPSNLIPGMMRFNTDLI